MQKKTDNVILAKRCEYRDDRKVCGKTAMVWKFVDLGPGKVIWKGHLCEKHVNVLGRVHDKAMYEAMAEQLKAKEEICVNGPGNAAVSMGKTFARKPKNSGRRGARRSTSGQKQSSATAPLSESTTTCEAHTGCTSTDQS